MADAQVPPDAGDANSVPARRHALRLSDAEDVATTRLDMFGDPTLKEVLARPPPDPGDEALPQGAAEAEAPEAVGEPQQPAIAATVRADTGRLAQSLPEAP